MKYAYEKLMEEHNLTLSELPSDAKVGINAIKNIEKAVAMVTAKGRKISPETLAKIKANDKWVVNEILDYIEDTDENEEEMPEDTKEIIDEIKNEAQVELNDNQKYALEIENELKRMFESGTKEFTIESVKSYAKNTYNILFDSYEEGQENGVATSRYKLIETKPKVFTISKN